MLGLGLRLGIDRARVRVLGAGGRTAVLGVVEARLLVRLVRVSVSVRVGVRAQGQGQGQG